MSQAFILQVSVIWAIILRETRTRFGRHRHLGLVWLFIDPLLKVLVTWALFTALGRVAGYGMPLPLFLISGFLPWMLFTATVTRCMAAIDGNKALLYYRQVTTLDLFFARTVLELAIAIVVFFLSLGLAALANYIPDIEDSLMVAAGFFMISLLGMAMGLTIAAWCIVFPLLQQFVKHVIRVMFFISGIFYTVAQVPDGARSYLLINPLMHLIDIIRGGFFRTYRATYSSLIFAASVTLILLAFGLLSERLNRKKIVA